MCLRVSRAEHGLRVSAWVLSVYVHVFARVCASVYSCLLFSSRGQQGCGLLHQPGGVHQRLLSIGVLPMFAAQVDQSSSQILGCRGPLAGLLGTTLKGLTLCKREHMLQLRWASSPQWTCSSGCFYSLFCI